MPEAFFDLADEMGFLLWQEFPYACAGYPITQETLADAEEETSDIIKSIGSHPSLWQWGGNNEVAQIQSKDPDYLPGTPGWGNYSALFLTAIGDTVSSTDPSRVFRSSSPGSGFETAVQPIPNPAQQPFLGDMHVSCLSLLFLRCLCPTLALGQPYLVFNVLCRFMNTPATVGTMSASPKAALILSTAGSRIRASHLSLR